MLSMVRKLGRRLIVTVSFYDVANVIIYPSYRLKLWLGMTFRSQDREKKEVWDYNLQTLPVKSFLLRKLTLE